MPTRTARRSPVRRRAIAGIAGDFERILIRAVTLEHHAKALVVDLGKYQKSVSAAAKKLVARGYPDIPITKA